MMYHSNFQERIYYEVTPFPSRPIISWALLLLFPVTFMQSLGGSCHSRSVCSYSACRWRGPWCRQVFEVMETAGFALLIIILWHLWAAL